MGLTDCHAHLADPVFDVDRDAVLDRAAEAGVETIVTVGETLEDAKRILELAPRYPSIAPAIGLYPTYLDPAQAAAIEGLLRENLDRVVAIGEVGLDYWKVKEPEQREIQRAIFARFIALSVECDRPLNVHSRSAGKYAVALLLEHGAKRVQLHAFDGKPSAAMPAVEAGYFFSIPPSVVRSQQKQKLVRRLPLDCLLVETDSPVLSAVPGERNEPCHARIALRAIAELKGISEARAEAAIVENTVRLLGPRPRNARKSQNL